MLRRRHATVLSEAAPSVADDSVALIRRTARPTVLLIEDDTEMREMLTWVLRRDGFIVIEAANGDDALEWLGIGLLEGQPSHLPSLIVSDIRLPYFSGLEILEGVSISPQRIPVILITGFGDTETHELASELGAACVLDKPFPVEALLEAAHAALGASAEWS
jgi:DNA-binding response OmpR family regulator